MGKNVSSQDMNNRVRMTIGAQESQFVIGGRDNVITLPVGYELISSRYFRHSPPTYDDIEYAINYIEDEIERVAKDIPYDGYSLETDVGFIRNLARLSLSVPGLNGDDDSITAAEQPQRFYRDDLERLFGRYAEIAAGRPAQSDEPDTSSVFFAQLLIFREYMHHLKFGYILI